MGLHKLTAGDGYTYLTRQVAAHDSTERGHSSLGGYYSERGESPGRWLGDGLTGLRIEIGAPVTEAQMKSLFGEGRHPDADSLAAAVIAAGGTTAQAVAAGSLGRPFNVYDGASTFQVRVAREFTTYNYDQGVPWNAPIPAETRAQLRTAVADRMFTEEHGRPAEDPRELAGFVARGSRQATTAVAGYDLTFSPVKSVSALWALASREVAEQIRAAHDAAVTDTISWLEREAAFTRVGHAGVRQVAVGGLVAAAFTHRDTRAGDPDLHTHVAVSNKVQTLGGGEGADGAGRWLAVDGRVLYKANVAASERYNTRLEGELTARLGLRFVDRPEAGDKRPVREVAGVNPLLSRWWSTRRRDIEVRRSRLAADFQSRHGRPPTAVEAIALAQQATLETRDAKHEPRSEADQRAMWRRQADQVLGAPGEVDAMVDAALGHSPAKPSITTAWVAATATSVVTTVETSRATWQVWHLRAEAERQARTARLPLSDLDTAVDRVVDAALAGSVRLGTPDPVVEPDGLRRADGESVYDVHGSTRYTSTRVLDAERRLLEAAVATGGRAISEVRVGIAVAEEAANGVVLNDAQTAMVRALATSGARLQLAVAPAGTGKTTAMRVLGRAWADAGGHVLGLAPSAQAAHELSQVLDGHTDTLAKLTWTIIHPTITTSTVTGLTAQHGGGQRPGWVDRIGPRTLVIIDEAGQTGTTELAAAVDYITARGGSVRLIGDDQQLASVAAGGILRDIAHTAGAVTLTQVRRFDDPAEAAATLAVRDGDTSAVGFYADHGRVHVGDIGSVTDQAYDAWAADRRSGLDTILLAPTRELVTRLNTRARADRLAETTAPGSRHEVRLVDGNHASTGDTIVSRRNERRLIITGGLGGDWVRNGDRWTVESVHPDGSLTARRLNSRGGRPAATRSVTLPAAYVAEDVQLGYATTVHAAQGMTTDTSHTVVIGAEPRQLLYVAVSRGRASNHLYLATASDGDPHQLIRPETLSPPTALDVLAAILERDGSQQSANTTRRDLDSAARQLHQAAARYHDALGFAAAQILGPDALTALDQQLEAIWPGLTQEPAFPTLRSQLALIAADGADPLHMLTDAAGSDRLHCAHDRAAVLDWRLTTTATTRAGGTDRPLRWLPAIPALLASHPDWGPYLRARATRVTTLAQQVHRTAAAWSPTQAPPWAHHLTAPGAENLRGDVAVWRAAFAVPEDDLRTTGPRQAAAEAATHHQRLDHRIHVETGPSVLRGPGSSALETLPDAVRGDPHLSRLQQRLASLERAGVSFQPLLDNALRLPRPLPDEYAADALWWRITRHLGPAAVRATDPTSQPLRPDWAPVLAELLGADTANRVMADPAWPALVAAVHAHPAEWTPQQLITAAANSVTSASSAPVVSVVHVTDLCDALVWRVATLTDIPDDLDDLDTWAATPRDPLDAANAPPDDAYTLPPWPTPSPDSPRPPATAPAANATAARIVQLNRAALAYYEDAYPKSWAPGYLEDRLGTDLSNHPTFRVGYAPPGPTSLIRHLASNSGATERELLDAGLARRTDRGNLVDAFRDRLVFPIHRDHDVVGFIARRNPTKDTEDHDRYAGPKYLNTRTTAAFTKGNLLYGLAEGDGALKAGAIPVLVEGPLDAIAVTVAANGTAVGVAPLGTALTTNQAQQLRPFFHHESTRIVVATDPDQAGWLAARKAFWLLTQVGADPQHVSLTDGLDPADLLRERGSQALETAVATARPVAQNLTEALITEAADDLHSPATRLRLVKQSGQIIGALPPTQWLTHINRVTRQLDLPPGMLHLEVADAGHAWTTDPATLAVQRISEIAATRTRQTKGPQDHWTGHLEAASPGISHSPDWPSLNLTLKAAHGHGFDVEALLTRATAAPLTGTASPATQLRLRLLTDMDQTATATGVAPVQPLRATGARRWSSIAGVDADPRQVVDRAPRR